MPHCGGPGGAGPRVHSGLCTLTGKRRLPQGEVGSRVTSVADSGRGLGLRGHEAGPVKAWAGAANIRRLGKTPAQAAQLPCPRPAPRPHARPCAASGLGPSVCACAGRAFPREEGPDRRREQLWVVRRRRPQLSPVHLAPPQARSVLAQLQGHQGPVTAAEFCVRQPHVVVSVSEDRCFKVRGRLTHRAGLEQLGCGTVVQGLTFVVAAMSRRVVLVWPSARCFGWGGGWGLGSWDGAQGLGEENVDVAARWFRGGPEEKPLSRISWA